MASLPRDISKWVQSLNLSLTIKNFRRDFANGFLAAEVLSKFYPLDVEMHSYNNGTSSHTKKSNWRLLEKCCFKKYKIPVTADLVLKIIENDSESIIEFLTIVYKHVGKKGPPSNGKINATPSILSSSHNDLAKLSPIHRSPGSHATLNTLRNSHRKLNPEPQGPNTSNASKNVPSKIQARHLERTDSEKHGIVVTNKKALSLLSIDEDHIPRDCHEVSKISSLRIICTELGVKEPYINFARGTFSPSVARETICRRMEAMSMSEVTSFKDKLGTRFDDVAYCLQHDPPSDTTTLCDVFLPSLLHFHPKTRVFQLSLDILKFVGTCSRKVVLEDSLNRLIGSNEWPVIVEILCSTIAMEKIAPLMFVINSFMPAYEELPVPGADSSENTESLRRSAVEILRSHLTSTAFTYSMASIQHLEPRPIPKDFARLYFTEGFGFCKPQTLDLRNEMSWFQLATGLHMLAGVVPDPAFVMSDFEEVAAFSRRLLFQENTVSCLAKAWIKLVAAVIEYRQPQDMVWYHRAAEACHLSKGDVLRTALIVLAPLLTRHPKLCSPFSRGVNQLSESTVVEILSISQTKDITIFLNHIYHPEKRGFPRLKIDWDLPILETQQRIPIVEVWNPLGVAMGVLNVISQTIRRHSDNTYILPATTMHLVSAISRDLPSKRDLDQHPHFKENWIKVWNGLRDLIFMSLGSHDKSRVLIAIEVIGRIWSRGLDNESMIPSLVATLMYVLHSSPLHCQDIVVRWVRDLMKRTENDGLTRSLMAAFKGHFKETLHTKRLFDNPIAV